MMMMMWCNFQLVLINLILIKSINSSAIPMWEYLSKQEKMSYLYSMFTNQVDEFCKDASTPPMKNCYQELLKYGLGRLKHMPEDHLDAMDPYQRNANDIIWDSMMEGHEMMKNPRKTTTTTTTPKPNSYEDESFTNNNNNDNDDSYQGAASARIDTAIYYVAPPSQQRQNHLSGVNIGKPQYYTYPQNYQQYHPKLSTTTTTTTRPIISRVPVIGPMVVKVYPDGRPVNEASYTLPQDDDLRQYQMSHIRLPNF